MNKQVLCLSNADAAASDAAELTAFYQPVVTAADYNLIACEALTRWSGPAGPLQFSPTEFVRRAKQPALNMKADEWILGEACRQLQEWGRRGEMADVGMWVTATARQLDDLAFPDRVQSLLEATNVEASSVRLQVAETALGDLQGQDAALVMRALQELGVRVILDEFGSGYSSLRQISRLPISGIKLDRALVSEVRRDRSAPAMVVDAAASIAHSLSVPLVANGVENTHQLETTTALGCRFAQGDVIARPMLADEIRDWSLRGATNLAIGTRRRRLVPSRAVGIGEAARDLRVSVSTIRRWADCGRLTSVRTPGGHRRILTADVGREARRLAPVVKLNTMSVPSAAAPAVGALLDDQGDELVAAASRDIYMSRASGWFSSTTSSEARRLWIAALGDAFTSGVYPEGVQASIAFFRQSDQSGTTVLERQLLIGRVRIRLTHLLRMSDAERSDIAAVTRLMKAIEHATLRAET